MKHMSNVIQLDSYRRVVTEYADCPSWMRPYLEEIDRNIGVINRVCERFKNHPGAAPIKGKEESDDA